MCSVIGFPLGNNETKTKVFEDTNYYSDDLCQNWADYLLRQNTILQSSINITTIPMYHLDVNKLIRKKGKYFKNYSDITQKHVVRFLYHRIYWQKQSDEEKSLFLNEIKKGINIKFLLSCLKKVFSSESNKYIS